MLFVDLYFTFILLSIKKIIKMIKNTSKDVFKRLFLLFSRKTINIVV